jgi:hypothetical protein
VKCWGIIADNLSKAGWSLGWVSTLDLEGRTIWIADAHREDGKRFVVRANEKLTAFVELESATRPGQVRIKRALQRQLAVGCRALRASGVRIGRTPKSFINGVMGILPLLGRCRGFDRCYGSFDRLVSRHTGFKLRGC